MKAIWNKSGNAMVDNHGPYDDTPPLACPICKTVGITETRVCCNCDKRTPYLTCPICHDQTMEVNVCDDCGHEWE
jgi:hypothetical protein